MNDTVTIYDARTNLSKYVKMAKAGQTIVIGAYGIPEAKLVMFDAPIEPKIRKLGIWRDRKDLVYSNQDLVGPDPDIIADFEESINRDFPE